MQQQQQQQQQAQQIGLGNIKDSFTSGMNFFKRRFSSSDIVQDVEDEAQRMAMGVGDQPAVQSARPSAAPMPTHRPDASGFSLQGLTNKMSSTISAPTSPTKSHGAGGSMSQSVYSQMQGLTKNIFQAATGQKAGYNKEHSKCLLVIDDLHTDWSKYFRSKKVLNDWDVRVEQAEFVELSLASFSDAGCLVDMQCNRGGSLTTRTFRPDFVMVRQHVRNAHMDHRNIIIGLFYGGVPSLNSLHSIYNFADKPWVFAHLLMLQRKLGREKFPLIEQVYCPNYKEMISQQMSQAKLPVVIKIGHAYAGLGKIRAASPVDLQDIGSVVAMGDHYCTTEPFVDGKYDIHVQKIGQSYKAFMRKSISGNWKANQGSAMLEQIAMTDRYKLWVDEVATLFGGMDICSVGAVVDKDGQEYIFEANDCAFTLLGETQEEDRRQIADLVLAKMNHMLGLQHALSRRESAGAAALANFIKHESPYHQQGQQIPPQPPAGASPISSRMPGPPVQGAVPQQPRQGSVGGGSAPMGPTQSPASVRPQQPSQMPVGAGAVPHAGAMPQAQGAMPQRPPATAPPQGQQPPPRMPNAAVSPPQGGATQTVQQSFPQQRPPMSAPRGAPPPRPTRQPSLPSQASGVADGAPPPQNPDDTMGNLKKTFAGIFGDM